MTAKSELGSVEELQQLSLLQTLELRRLSAVPRDVHNFKFVQSLRLHGIEEPVCSIESYTALTHLRICTHHPYTVKKTVLPAGDGVKLRSLDIWGSYHQHIFHLRNLASATHLEKMSLYSASPQNIEHIHLLALPFLTQVQLMHPDCALLQTLSLSSSLQYLCVSGYQQPTLPSRFSLLTQLKSLIISQCNFAELPDCLLHLSQLEMLGIYCSTPVLQLSDSILGLAKWPNLKSLDIVDCSQSQLPVESQLLLGQLQEQLRDCTSSCKFSFG